MKRFTFVVLLGLVASLAFAQSGARSGATKVARLDTTVTTAWIGVTIPTGTLSRSVYEMEIANNTAGTLYYALRAADTAYASTAGGWRYSNTLICATTGTPVFFYHELVWTGTIWLKASTTSAVTIRCW